MKVHCIGERPAPFGKRLLIHHYMFHGLGQRKGGDPFLDCPDANLTTDVRDPLEIWRNGRWMPDICSPCSNLVVSDEVRKKMAAFGPVEFLKVEFLNLIDYPIPDDGVLALEDADVRINDCLDRRNILRVWPNVPDFHRTIGDRFEVLMAFATDLAEDRPEQYPGS
ncbi:MAG TPA: hypothetical protein VKU82_10740, partial [Planctomycetaceae bacterium]|nr:hypothetical protein [Planctomycetaceae bacterium]